MIIKTFAILTYTTISSYGYQALNVERFDNLNECLAVRSYIINEKIKIGYFEVETDLEMFTKNLKCTELEYPTNE